MNASLNWDAVGISFWRVLKQCMHWIEIASLEMLWWLAGAFLAKFRAIRIVLVSYQSTGCCGVGARWVALIQHLKIFIFLLISDEIGVQMILIVLTDLWLASWVVLKGKHLVSVPCKSFLIIKKSRIHLRTLLLKCVVQVLKLCIGCIVNSWRLRLRSRTLLCVAHCYFGSHAISIFRFKFSTWCFLTIFRFRKYCLHVSELFLQRSKHLLWNLELNSSWMVLNRQCILAQILYEHLVLIFILTLSHL